MCFIARIEIAFHVFSKNICFEVDSIARFAVAKIGVLVGVGNYGNFRDVRMFIPARDGEADAIDGNRALGDNVARKFFGGFHAE